MASPIDLHHINYRRGFSDDTESNLISLCRMHHDFVHGAPSATRERIHKEVAQTVLRELIATPGVTGMAHWRQLKAAWALSGLCEHGNDQCYHCTSGSALR